MSITYNTGIPAAGNNPSTDQPNMKTNNDNIATYVAVDHVGFNTSGSGKHNQVTFNSSNPPASPTTPPILFTNTQDGAGNALPGSLAQLFYYTGAASASKNQYVSQASGSTLLPGGIIMKWGVIVFAASSAAVTFASAFPNNFWAVSFSVITTTPGTNGVVSFNSIGSPSGFTAYQQTSNPLTAYYIAIGN